MKVNSQNLKLKFLSQLRKHLKSPRLNKILHKRRRKKKSLSQHRPNPKLHVIPGSSPKNSFRAKLIKRAGEKLKDGFKRNWDSDYVARNREELIEFALKKHKIITTSSIVTSDDVPKLSERLDDSLTDKHSERRCSPSVVESSVHQECNDNRAFYLHCSSEESSPSTTEKSFYDKTCTKSPNASETSFQNNETFAHPSCIDESIAESRSQCCEVAAMKLQKEDVEKIDIAIQCSPPKDTDLSEEAKYFDSIFQHHTAKKIETDPLPRKEPVVADHAMDGIDIFSITSSSTAEKDASVMLERMAKFLQSNSNPWTVSPDLPTSSLFASSEDICTPRPPSDYPPQSYSARSMRPHELLFEDRSSHSRARNTVSENISQFRPGLLKQRHNDVTKAWPPPNRHPHYLCNFDSSDSESSDDEILKKMRRKLEAEDDTIERFFATDDDEPCTSRSLLQLSVCRRLLENDSSPEFPFHKPFVRH